MKPDSLGVYIHVPFCARKCDYCGFYSVPLGSPEALKARSGYAASVERDIMFRSGVFAGMDVDTIYFGGGTPSLLSIKELDSILKSLDRVAAVSPDAEISIEMNPSDVSPAFLGDLKSLGFNRFVLGVQTLTEKWHDVIGRARDVCTLKDLETFFSVEGAVHCLDIIAGIPGQDMREYAGELERLCGFGPDHISVYLLSIEKGSPLEGRMKYSDDMESLQGEAFTVTRNILLSRGYDHYEISNFARPGFRSRHNMKYWTFQPYAGFGPGSHSFYDGERYINRMTVMEYSEKAQPVLERDERTVNSAMVEYIMTGLRLFDGMSLGAFRNQFGADLPAGVRHRMEMESGRQNLIISGKDEIVRLSEKGMLLADRIIYEILQDLL
jgi:oxygen-independent coproporphyrinogen-3 oxidase